MIRTVVWAVEVFDQNFVIVTSNPVEHPSVLFQKRYPRKGIDTMQGNFSVVYKQRFSIYNLLKINIFRLIRRK